MASKNVETLAITPPNFGVVELGIEGMAPYVQLKFSAKAKGAMREKMEAGSQGKKGNKKTARDFDDDYRQALHQSADGWYGIPSMAIKDAMVTACSLPAVDFHMTKARMALFLEQDGVDAEDGTPLIKIKGAPEAVTHHVRNATGVADLRVRAMWREWSATVRIRFDQDTFSLQDVVNLLSRAGMQVGIGEGRPASKKSKCGMGWGMFQVKGEET
ncbi:MAG: hypothetical protein WC683_09680 [bacterium]